MLAMLIEILLRKEVPFRSNAGKRSIPLRLDIRPADFVDGFCRRDVCDGDLFGRDSYDWSVFFVESVDVTDSFAFQDGDFEWPVSPF